MYSESCEVCNHNDSSAIRAHRAITVAPLVHMLKSDINATFVLVYMLTLDIKATLTSASSPDHTQSTLAQYENSANGPNPWYQFINSML